MVDQKKAAERRKAEIEHYRKIGAETVARRTTVAPPAVQPRIEIQPERNDAHMTEADATLIAAKFDAANVRRAFINEHCGDLPAHFAEQLPMTANRTELTVAASAIRKDFTENVLPVLRKQHEANEIAADKARREKIKGDLIASGMPPGQAEYQANIKLPGEIGFNHLGHDLGTVQPALTQQDKPVQPHEAESIAREKETGGASAGEMEFARSLKIPGLV